MRNKIISKQVLLLLFGVIFLLACNNEETSSKRQSTKNVETGNSSLKKVDSERLEELRTIAKESKNVNLSDVFIKRGAELAAKYCKCGEQKDVQAQKNCRSRLEQTYKTIDDRLEKARKATFAKAYNEGKKACK